MKKIIFLDIDGVLNCSKTTETFDGLLGLDKKLVKNYYRILEEAHVEVVLSSTWRLGKNWIVDLCRAGLNTDKIIDRTPSKPLLGGSEMHERGLEIYTWLVKNDEEDVDYIIIDDDSDMLPHQKHFKTNWETGLTDEITDEIIKHLNR